MSVDLAVKNVRRRIRKIVSAAVSYLDGQRWCWVQVYWIMGHSDNVAIAFICEVALCTPKRLIEISGRPVAHYLQRYARERLSICSEQRSADRRYVGSIGSG